MSTALMTFAALFDVGVSCYCWHYKRDRYV